MTPVVLVSQDKQQGMRKDCMITYLANIRLIYMKLAMRFIRISSLKSQGNFSVQRRKAGARLTRFKVLFCDGPFL